MPLFSVVTVVTYDGRGGSDHTPPDERLRGAGLVPRLPVIWRAGLSRSQGTARGKNANELSMKTPRWYALTQTQPGVARTKNALATGQLRRYNLIGATKGAPGASTREA